MDSPGPPPHPQAIQDAEHLKLLAIFHYVVGGMTMLFGSFPILHVIMGIMMLNGKFATGSPTSPGAGMGNEFGWVFIGMGSMFILIFWTFAVLLIYAGRCLSARRKHTYCFVMACLSCVHFPLGTALGVFTILVLQRPSVQGLFDKPPMPGAYLNR
ncbi:hypothetical protein OKA05_15320 [Luteolibacter arcticus]|uniref:Uncharacterized protein n=1 Tax=Luteolibacter arcticus TaxID=1581411 RepID=A0ABT3GKE0_9BACT|nr:hypothetical protein [Luteolibacter arcticus]MCW1923936.1 hypothetical protein [Luteolibacter arcticus]